MSRRFRFFYVSPLVGLALRRRGVVTCCVGVSRLFRFFPRFRPWLVWCWGVLLPGRSAVWCWVGVQVLSLWGMLDPNTNPTRGKTKNPPRQPTRRGIPARPSDAKVGMWRRRFRRGRVIPHSDGCIGLRAIFGGLFAVVSVSSLLRPWLVALIDCNATYPVEASTKLPAR